MTDDLQQARIEAGAEAMYRRLFPGRMAWLDLPEAHRGGWRDRAAEILAAADAHLPSVEQIAEEIAGHPIGSGYYRTTVGVDEAREIADAVVALLRGEVADDE